jgi:hypothetical protein
LQVSFLFFLFLFFLPVFSFWVRATGNIFHLPSAQKFNELKRRASKPGEASTTATEAPSRYWAAYGQMQWNAPAGLHPGGQGMNELARADNDGCCVKTTIAVAKHRLILKTKTAVFFNDMVFYPFMLWLVQR